MAVPKIEEHEEEEEEELGGMTKDQMYVAFNRRRRNAVGMDAVSSSAPASTES